ncbi:MAG: glycine--tRNA ligase subunit beta [Pseudomonadota bacterium]
MPDLLIELFSEEIPARMQRRAAADLQKLMTDALVEAGLTYQGAVAHCTPRRLALSVQGLTDESPTTTEERRGPRVDAPEKALDGFLRSTGLTKDQLEIRDDKKGQVYVAKITTPGRPAGQIVTEALDATIRNFPWPKSMRWGDGSLRWVRPLRRILCILTREDGTEVVPLDIDGIPSGDRTEGHRFMAPTPFSVTSFDDYEAKLKRAFVVLSSEERAEAIRQEAANRAFAAGLEVVPDEGLLAEVAGLVEWPVVLMGRIGADFLDLPPEVLQTSMREHQKFFSLRDKAGKITHFITVANRETADDGATILDGNSRVLAARLADAKFFWENDLATIRQKGLEGMAAPLAQVTFHAKLGSQADRIQRIEALARDIAPHVGAQPDLAAEAARICKADLASEMVYEFPELQGIMGRYYAEAAGHDDGVPEACEEHYSPLGPSDEVPLSTVSVTVALADKLDTLAGFWAINEKPTGSKDPYALRRAALGVIRLLLGTKSKLNLLPLVSDHLVSIFQALGSSWKIYRLEDDIHGNRRRSPAMVVLLDDSVVEEPLNFETVRNHAINGELSWDEEGSEPIEQLAVLVSDLLSYLHDRLKVHLRDEGIRHDVIATYFAGDWTDDLTDLVARARALNTFLATENGENLIQGYKRAKNILDQAQETDGVEYSYGADPKLAETTEEKALFSALDEARPKIDAALKAEHYDQAMEALAALRAPIDAFFEAVQVNADNQVTRRNRLNLLSEIVQTCEKIADLHRINA